MSDDPAPIHRFSCDGMAATFEVMIRGHDKAYAESAALAAFNEARQIEKELSRFIGYSDVSQINRLHAGESAPIGIAAFECLRLANKIHTETHGAFDVTIGPLLTCWQASSDSPSHIELVEARARTGMHLLHIDEGGHTASPAVDGMQIDLGGIGKGYAVDCMAALLRDWTIEDALIHSGESTALALGLWTVAIRDPETQSGELERIDLCDRALSGSGLLLQGRHIIDPRTGRPAEGRPGAWAACAAGEVSPACAARPSAAVSDALSTAFMIMSTTEVEQYCAAHPDISAMLAIAEAGGRKRMRFGRWE